MTAILYSFRRCPYAMRGRMGLHISGLNYEHREVLLRDKPPTMLALSPKGTVPVYQHSDGTLIEESLDLLFWALEQNDPEAWLATDISAAKALIARNDGPFKHHLDRYKYKSRYDETAKRGDTDIEHRTAAEVIIRDYETRLTQHAFLLGAHQTVADIAIFPFMRQFANTDRAWWDSANAGKPPFPQTHDWLERHLNSQLFKTIMSKHPLWQDISSPDITD